jgi:LPXTG-motif cell wall-anchored protein
MYHELPNTGFGAAVLTVVALVMTGFGALMNRLGRSA